jgi:hypothetical protein
MDLSALSRVPRWVVFCVGVILIFAVGVLDYQTGWDFSI